MDKQTQAINLIQLIRININIKMEIIILILKDNHKLLLKEVSQSLNH